MSYFEQEKKEGAEGSTRSKGGNNVSELMAAAVPWSPEAVGVLEGICVPVERGVPAWQIKGRCVPPVPGTWYSAALVVPVRPFACLLAIADEVVGAFHRYAVGEYWPTVRSPWLMQRGPHMVRSETERGWYERGPDGGYSVQGVHYWMPLWGESRPLPPQVRCPACQGKRGHNSVREMPRPGQPWPQGVWVPCPMCKESGSIPRAVWAQELKQAGLMGIFDPVSGQ